MSSYYLGIDASKGYSDFVMLDHRKEPIHKDFQLDDTAGGHRRLEAYLSDFFQAQPAAEVFAALESTGGYENNWYNRLIQLSHSFPLHVARLNPARVKANSQAAANHNKTDPISAKDVAEYLISHPQKVNYYSANHDEDHQENYPMLRRQWNYIRLNEKIESQLRNHLGSLLYTSMPEILNFCRSGIPKWLLRILKKYPSYQALKNAGLQKLIQIPYVSSEKAERLLKLIQQGIGDSNDVSAQIIASISKEILELEENIQHHKKLLEHNYQEAQAEIDLLTTYIGIAVYSAVGLLLNIPGGIKSFPIVKKLASLWGIHPIYKQSGDGTWGFHMSKAGRAEPRAILYRVTWSALQHNPVIKELYARCRAKGMKPKAAMGVCMHKTLRIVYGMLKNKTAFNPQIDRQNQLKFQNSIVQMLDSHLPKINLRRFDQNAPVSNRQYKKRKKQTQSQDEKLVTYGISESAFSP